MTWQSFFHVGRTNNAQILNGQQPVQKYFLQRPQFLFCFHYLKSRKLCRFSSLILSGITKMHL